MAFNELQRQVGENDVKFGWSADKPENVMIHMQEELGEIAREILIRNKYKKGDFELQKINDEIADLMYLTLKLANLLDLKIDDAWGRVQGRYCLK